MKTKIIAFFLITCFSLQAVFPVTVLAQGFFAEDDFGTIEAEFSDNLGETEELSVRVSSDKVYVDAEQLGSRLGYMLYTNDGEIVLKFAESANSYLGTIIFSTSNTHVKRLQSFSVDINGYSAPCKSIIDETGIWIPLDYSLKMMKASGLVVGDILEITMPSPTVQDAMALVLQDSRLFSFNILSDFEYGDARNSVLGFSTELTRVCSWFLDLLFLSGKAWGDFAMTISANPQVANLLDYSIGEKFSMLMCTKSDEELKSTLKGLKDFKGLLDNSKSFGKILDKINEEDIAQATSAYVRSLEDLLATNEGLSECNELYDKVRGLVQNRPLINDFNNTISGLNAQLKDDLLNLPNILSTVGSIFINITDFNNRDEFTVAAMDKYLSESTKSGSISETARSAMETSVNYLRSNIMGYLLGNYLQENLAENVFDALELAELFSSETQLLKLGWNLTSKYVPYIADGLSAADEFQVSLLASIVQTDAQKMYQEHLQVGESNYAAESLYELSQYFYIFVKAGYVARESALAYANHTVSNKENLEQVTILEKSKNAIALYVLSELKRAQIDNSNGAFGFLPEDNTEYLKTHSDKPLLKIIRHGSNPDFDLGIKGSVNYSLYIPMLEKAIAERPYSGDDYGILYDLDKDGVEELFMLHTYSGGAVPEMGYSIYDINDGALVTRAEKQTLIVMAGGGGCMAGISETDGGTYFYAYSLQIGDVYADSVITVYDQSFSVYKTFEANMETEGTHITQDSYITSFSIDGSPCAVAEYQLLLSTLLPFDTTCFQLENTGRQIGRFYNGQWYGETLTALLNRLKASAEPDVDETINGEDAYREVLDMFYRNIQNGWTELDHENWDDPCDPDSVSYLLYSNGTLSSIGALSLSEIGYCIRDVDGNGIPELMVTRKWFSEKYPGIISDLYTLSAGQPIHLASGGDRAWYYLTENGSISNEGSGSAFTNVRCNYTIDVNAGKLKVAQAVIYDATANSTAPWYYSETEYYDPQAHDFIYDALTGISEDEAQRIIESFPQHKAYPLTTFDQYRPGGQQVEEQQCSDVAALVGTWGLDLQKTMQVSGASIIQILGTAYKYGNSMEINADGSFSYYAGFFGGTGTWQATGNGMTYQITTFDEGNAENNELRFEDGYLIMPLPYLNYKLCWVMESREQGQENSINPIPLALSTEQRYRINIFLSNFSEQWFHEEYDNTLRAWVGSSQEFTSQNADPMELLRFAWLYAKINMQAVEWLEQNDGPYYGVSIDTIDAVCYRFFGRSIADDISEAQERGDILVLNGLVCESAADGAAHNRMTLVEDVSDLSDGTLKASFKIYSVEIGDGSIVYAGGTIHDKSVYYLTQEEADRDSRFMLEGTGEAILRTYITDSGTESYQLVSYQVV